MVMDEIVSFFCQHLVPLEITYDIEGPVKTQVYTSFVLSIDSHWVLLTAGHCINRIDDILSCGHSIVGAD